MLWKVCNFRNILLKTWYYFTILCIFGCGCFNVCLYIHANWLRCKTPLNVCMVWKSAININTLLFNISLWIKKNMKEYFVWKKINIILHNLMDFVLTIIESDINPLTFLVSGHLLWRVKICLRCSSPWERSTSDTMIFVWGKQNSSQVIECLSEMLVWRAKCKLAVRWEKDIFAVCHQSA